MPSNEHKPSGPANESTNSSCCYIFGFGSIINSDTHAGWLKSSSSCGGESNNSNALQGRHARILKSFGYKRSWNFRSSTGFTALGITRAADTNNGEDGRGASNINGVLFRIPLNMLPDFDRREIGYDRVLLDATEYEILPPDYYGPRTKDPDLLFDSIGKNEQVYVYVPQSNYCAEADENHPILQSYVDTVLQGCLEWAGEKMAREFVETTDGWSPFFLNDTPSSRRPWLFRKQYDIIDRILSQAAHTHYSDRRHPEEFSSAFLIKLMRGMWNVPRRNRSFVGRDAEIGRIHSLLTQQRTGSVAKVEVAGMGGVGKTQITAEYCYRFYGSYYGLVIWLNAEGAENLVACYRQLMSDTSDVEVKDKDTDEIITAVKSRLFRSKFPWLLIFDNLEDKALLEKFLPHGSGSTQGSVLVSTRIVEPSDRTIFLDCFSVKESVELLCRSAGAQNVVGDNNVRAAHDLASQLGHLPLALGMAAAYMQRCDVTCSEYLARYVSSGSTSTSLLAQRALLVEYPMGVAQSLDLSLNAIKNENVAAREVLCLLCWMGPDLITKPLIRSLLKTKNSTPLGRQGGDVDDGVIGRYKSFEIGCAAASLVLVVAASIARKGTIRQGLGCFAGLALSATAASHFLLSETSSRKGADKVDMPADAHLAPSNFSAMEYEQTDQIWNILKSYSILVVKGGQGSMHRLLAEALRASQSEVEQQCSLEICIRTILQLWDFSGSRIETWSDSEKLLDHVKSVVSHAWRGGQFSMALEASRLSKDAAIFSAMVLNRFEEARSSLELSLEILGGNEKKVSKAHQEAQSEALHELGRNFRYQGHFDESEETLKSCLAIRKQLVSNDDITSRQRLADTLHELGVLEVKKHNLESAATYLNQALTLRRSMLLRTLPSGEVEASSAATLHQLAAVEVQKKPPSLHKAESLLQEALGLRMQIGQRAATLKQLARVCIRQGLLEKAEAHLAKALELYFEMYGESSLHINVASVKFQLGVLAFQREQLGEAWAYFTECLQIRQRVYAYARPTSSASSSRRTSGADQYPAHLDVSAVLHELACVAFAQHRYEMADDMLRSEKESLERLQETSSQPQRIYQARLTNLTWLIKCAKERGDDKKVKAILLERSSLKRMSKQKIGEPSLLSCTPDSVLMQQEAISARSVVRQFALASPGRRSQLKSQLLTSLDRLGDEAMRARSGDVDCKMSAASIAFRDKVRKSMADKNNMARMMLEACDELRDVLREHNVIVQDKIRRRH